MYYQTIGLILTVGLFIAILGALDIGKNIAIWQSKHYFGIKNIDTHLTEGAIFALLGLLIALTFNSAAQKFDHRRLLIIDETNAIGTAYLRLDLLPQPIRAELQADFREYIHARLDIYQKIGQQETLLEAIVKTEDIQKRIWEKAIKASNEASLTATPIILLPALNTMFDIANTRIGNTQIHAPIQLFFILIALALLGSVLAGYRISTANIVFSLHFISYALVLSIIIYAIVDMEYPRLGIIRVDSFDQMLYDLEKTMEPSHATHS